MKHRIYLAFIYSFILIISFGCASRVDREEIKLSEYQAAQTYAVEKIVNQSSKEKPKNIILMVGDGMSLSAMYTAWTLNHGKLNIENCEYIGLSKTYSADDLITDSGAGGTAFATGHKTKNGSVGVDADGKPQRSVLEIARDNQLSTGLIATCNILDATPASFIAKIADRDKWDEIAIQYVNNDVDFVCGGGWDFFKTRKDGRDLTKELSAKGFQLPRTVEELEKIESGKVFALIANDFLPVPKERGDALPRAAMKAIELLSQNNKGFFLMIEGSMIDDWEHRKNLEIAMDEALDFDRTIGEVLKWAAKDGETLVVITADHGTGGLTLLGGDLAKGKVEGHFSTSGHSGVMVPVYSFGPKAETFAGIYENTDLFTKILQAYRFMLN